MKIGINIIVVDDNSIFLDGLISILNNKPKYQVIAKFNSGDDLLNTEPQLIIKADIILIDIEMPGKNGIEVTHILNLRYPKIKFIAITMYQDLVYLEQLVEHGFKGFVNKTQVSQKLCSTIDKVFEGKYTFPDDLEIIKTRNN